MKLYIAEKPSLGRAIADALPKPHKKQSGYIEAANGDIVTWCIGHLLEQAPPENYDPAFKQWKLEHFPIVPETWQLVTKKETSKQLTVVKNLVKKASQIVHAGDPDREGQLLVDEVLSHLKVAKSKINNAQRCLINDLNLPAVKKALSSLRPNTEFVPLSTSALARSRADWLYGINMTRLCTIHGGKSGYQGVLSVGRVQTPLLGLVVRRDEEIENFVSKPFYEVFANVITKDNQSFKAKWLPSENCAPYQDSENRVIVRKLAENVVSRICGQDGVVTKSDNKNKKQAPPLPYNLSSLQIDCAKRFGYNAKQVLDYCQTLYEKYKLITYPRSDSRYLPKEQISQAGQVLNAVASVSESLKPFVADANTQLKSKAWNDSKVDAHHAIIPTMNSKKPAQMTQPELNIYQQIARQYLAQFFPAYEYQEKLIELNIAGGCFRAKSKQANKQGWKILFPAAKPQADGQKEDQKDGQEQTLPNLSVNDPVHCNNAEIIDKATTPPAYFTDASLLSAMTSISRYVADKSLHKILKETDGIGTEATRAGIIELLFKRQYLIREGKQIKASLIGKKLIASLPELATTPDMTAIWESRLGLIAQKQFKYQDFMSDLEQQVKQIEHQIIPSAFTALKGEGKKPNFKRKYKKARAKTKTAA
ncbi:DNA topoisomerase III [Catenovulum maritimum]|uniref:DNA topoisomerase 3 n=1 Tax=Catenovulum maritimum TaxID=1513271 RepID=A0A0J8GV36_9ALTE|nr:DNA topoisomerase III [Catenovulum maritimum]KMT65169.1 DNA topoisomerase III [Catenovulum maritimum]